MASILENVILCELSYVWASIFIRISVQPQISAHPPSPSPSHPKKIKYTRVVLTIIYSLAYNLYIHCLGECWNFRQSFNSNVHVGAKFFQPQYISLKTHGNSSARRSRFEWSWDNESILKPSWSRNFYRNLVIVVSSQKCVDKIRQFHVLQAHYKRNHKMKRRKRTVDVSW